MKANIEVKDRREGEAIRAGLEDPFLRALVIITGLLKDLPPRSQQRVMQYVKDRLDDEHAIETPAEPK